MDMAMDMDMDIDLGPIDVPRDMEPTGFLVLPNHTEAEGTKAVDIPTGDAITHKVYLRGVDELTTDDLKVFAAERYPTDTPIRFDWIDDTSVNLVYKTPAAAMEALKSFSLPSWNRDLASMPLLQLCPAKTISHRPDIHLQVRMASSTDVKQPRAHEASRFYMLHPEHDPRESTRQQKDTDGDHRRRHYRNDERRRRQLRDRRNGYDSIVYDDNAGRLANAAAGSRRSSSSMMSTASDHGRRSRGGRLSDFYQSQSRSGEGASRDRSASPEMKDESYHPSDRRHIRRRTPPRNRKKELFPIATPDSARSPANTELFPDKTIAVNLKKELFPTKMGNAHHHRRSDAFDAADETADLFASSMAILEKGPLSRNTARVVESSFGRLRKTDSESDYDPHTRPKEADITIRGASKQQGPGVSIRGAAQKSHAGTLRELFPGKAGNLGKELFAEKLHGRSSRRNKAEDLFY